MKLSQFITRVKIQCPNISGVDDDAITLLLNEACDKVNLLTKVYKTYSDFNVVAEQQTYNFSTIATSYLGMDKKGVYLKNSDGEWDEIFPKTKDWIAEQFPDWINADSVSIPEWYWAEGDELGFHQKPSTSYASGGRVYHLKKRTDMSSGDHYPFTGSSTQITALSPLDDAIIAYVRWKLSPAVGAVTDADLREQEFLKECRKGAMQIKRRPDMTTDSTYQMSL
jgi:hypothetical protein